MLDGGGHDAAGIVASLAGLPAVNLIQRVGGGLSGDSRLARTCALSFGSVAGGAGGDAARRVAVKPDRGRGSG